ncbi:2-phospho-L-lactate guanylyltransferase [Klenkia soli]|uniref:Phosphoenolpyruvate guanylyltransferase n=1 Tax=Klenkia soli TaxID=1052260 RepID=A0A1H0HYL2_9ACTN|nr:2-phospho-L-lactate guanylyltransferase [Klenkia soli]SDO24257.1 2-phospho-L-lactate guanylyltransferase [Klenkia soli]
MQQVQHWSVVVPAKRLALAKTRLGPVVDRAEHEDLVLAMLGDTLAAAALAREVGSLWVVTADPRAAALATQLGARVVPDEPAGGLNAALVQGAAATGARFVAVLNSDLPALQADELDQALRAAAGVPRSFVADAEGTGTTLLAVTGGDLAPAFGPGSAAAHAVSGAVALAGDWPGLRRDVDTAEHLAAARALGAGPRTRAVAHEACA